MKILIFNWRDLKHSWAGGGEIYLFEQAKRWVEMEHEVTVFCGQDIEKDLPSLETIDGIKIYRRGNRYSLYLWAIWYYFRYFRGNADVVVDVVNGIPFFTPLFCRVPKISYVYHLHGNQFFYELPFPLNHFGFIIERFVLPLLYKYLPMIVISETTKKQLIDIGFNKKNISIVYCGINRLNRTKNSIKKFSAPTILYLGRIKKYKRVDLLVKIFPKIIEKMPLARLIIAGWGTEASNVANLVMKSPLRRKIALLGPVSNVEKKSLLSKSWIFVNPSIGEGWSMAVIEANLHGTPTISFDVSGLRESILSGKTGLLAKNEQDLIDNIYMLLNDNILREKLSTNAKKWANTFNWDHSAKESLHIIEQAKKGKKR